MPDLTRYPALRLAREVMQTRGLAGAAFNAAKEVALDMFIAGRIGFMDMAGLVETVLGHISGEARRVLARPQPTFRTSWKWTIWPVSGQ